MLYTWPWSRFELTTSVVIGTDCIGSCKSIRSRSRQPQFKSCYSTKLDLYVFTSTYIYVFTSTSIYVFTSTYIYVFTSTSIYVFTSTYIYVVIISFIYVFTSTYIYVFTSTYIYVFTSTYIYVFTSTYIYVFTSTYIYIIIISSDSKGHVRKCNELVSVVVVVRKLLHFKLFSEINETIRTKLIRNAHWMIFKKVYVFFVDRKHTKETIGSNVSKMVFSVLYVEHLFFNLSW